MKQDRLDAEAQKTDAEAEIAMERMREARFEEQEQNMGFETGQQRQDTEFQDQTQTMSENEVKRVVKLDECGMEAKKEEHLLRHWECTTRSEEMGLRKQEIELQKQELQLKRERDKHEIEMQERKNVLEMQQDEHRRRMNSTLW